MILSKGNKKISKQVQIFNIPAVKTCLNCKLCAGTCYARKSEKLYPNVLPFRNRNLKLTRSPNFVNAMIKEIKPNGIVRIHESGDFYNQSYINKWYEIARNRPDVRFYAYTKVLGLLDFSKLTSLPNVNILNSILPDNTINFGTLEGMSKKSNEFNIPICKDGQIGIKCMDTCKVCLTAKAVIFIKH